MEPITVKQINDTSIAFTDPQGNCLVLSGPPDKSTTNPPRRMEIHNTAGDIVCTIDTPKDLAAADKILKATVQQSRRGWQTALVQLGFSTEIDGVIGTIPRLCKSVKGRH